MRLKVLVLLSLALFIATVRADAQLLSSNTISPSRAADWSHVGIPGGLPDGAWTQCGSTIAAYSGSASAINSALSGCGANQYVLLGPGTFTLSSGIQFPQNTTGHLVLRGSGANSTFIVSTGSGINCGGFVTAIICIDSTDGTYAGNAGNTVYNWTGGYSQGSTQITLSSVSGITLNQTLLVLNQCDTGYSTSACTGASTDNGNYFVCAQIYTGTTGCAFNGPDGNAWRGQSAWQTEIVTVTAVNAGGCGATCVTISQPLKHPNWASGQSPQAVLIQPVPQDGVENLSIDGLNSSSPVGVMFYNAYQGWVSGTRMTNITTWFVNNVDVSHMIFQNNYFYHANCPTGCDPYGVRIQGGGDDLTVNNIFEQIRLSTAYDGPEAGGVVAYNYSINQLYASDFMFGAYWTHSAGDNFDLWEGNVGNQFQNDYIHGSHLSDTTFRNFFTGWESCGNGQCGGSTAKDSSTVAIFDAAYARYNNNIGNVLGTAGYHNAYQTNSTPGSNTAVLLVGSGDGAASPVLPTDSVTGTTMMRWGNYDVVSGAVRFCGSLLDTGWLTTCSGISEVPSGISPYPNSIPILGDLLIGQSALPPSFYLPASPAPSWFGSTPWPAIGPDVTGGNVGQCTGTLNTPGEFAGVPATGSSQCTGTSLASAWAGHVNAIPAMTCYFSMGGAPDGSGSALNFNANSCYGGSVVSGPPPPPPPVPNPPTNLIAVVQ
jgi:hypothetical protein